MAKLTGRTRHRLGGFLSRRLILQVEEEWHGIPYPHCSPQTGHSWRDAVVEDMYELARRGFFTEVSPEVYGAGRNPPPPNAARPAPPPPPPPAMRVRREGDVS